MQTFNPNCNREALNVLLVSCDFHLYYLVLSLSLLLSCTCFGQKMALLAAFVIRKNAILATILAHLLLREIGEKHVL